MAAKIIIPSTIKSATTALEGIDGLLTAKGWEKAAIVYAFTYDAPRGQGNVQRPALALTIAEFTKLKITGLEHRDTVTFYRKAWKLAMTKHGADPAIPGIKVALPTAAFPPIKRGSDGYDSPEGAVKTIKRIIAKHAGNSEVEAAISESIPEDSLEAIEIAKRTLRRKSTAEILMGDRVTRRAMAQAGNQAIKDALGKPKPRTRTPLPVGAASRKMVSTLTLDSLLSAVKKEIRALNQYLMTSDLSDDDRTTIIDWKSGEIDPQFDITMALVEAEELSEEDLRLLTEG